MHTQSFVLQIGDLLRNVGQEDEIVLENVKIELLSMCHKGVSMVCQMTAINTYTIYVRLLDITTQMTSTCDYCAQHYHYDVYIPSYELRFGIPVEIHKTRQTRPAEEDYDFAIDPKTETIDLSEAIYQAITMSTPIVFRCPDCDDGQSDDQDENDLYA